MFDLELGLSDGHGDATVRSGSIAPLALPRGLNATAITVDSIEETRRLAFGSTEEIERLRAWVDTPAACGVHRGVALWLLGRNAEAETLLAAESAAHPALVVCLARIRVDAGDSEGALALLGSADGHPEYTRARLSAIEARGNPDELSAMLEANGDELSAADQTYYTGRVREMRRDPEGAIALYEKVLMIDERHGPALFRLAVNVDLRGCDEEARTLYERALLCPPVNAACVMNLGILYEDLGNYRRAMQCYDLVVQANPHNTRARLYRRDAAASLTMYYDEEQQRQTGRVTQVLRTPVDNFEFSVRCWSCLMKIEARTLADLVTKNEAELRRRGFDDASIAEVEVALRHKGLHLGMDLRTPLSLSSQASWRPEVAGPQPDPENPDVTLRPVSQLDLSLRSRRVVAALQLVTIGDLAARTEAELLSCPNFGQTSLIEVRLKLDELGLALRG